MEAINAACIGWELIFNNSSKMKNRDTLLIISNMESANIIFITTCFKIPKFSFPLNLFVYFFLLSRWNRITKITFDEMNPASTVNAELRILSAE